MKKNEIIMMLMLFGLILASCGPSEDSKIAGESNSSQENDSRNEEESDGNKGRPWDKSTNIREEIWDESIKIANAVSYMVDEKMVIDTHITNNLEEKWFSNDDNVSNEEEKLYQSTLKLLRNGRTLVRKDFTAWNSSMYEQAFERVIDIIGHENIYEDNIDNDFVMDIHDSEAISEKQGSHIFELEDTDCSLDGNFIKATGYIKNIDKVSHNYIKVLVKYRDETDNVLDTDWTYAIDSQPLQPNERKSFEVMTKKVEGISRCTYSVTE